MIPHLNDDSNEDVEKILRLDELTRWYYYGLKRQFFMSKNGHSPFGNYYEFGVGFSTLPRYMRALQLFCNNFKIDPSKFHVFCFDSFEGLPDSKELADHHPKWNEGKMKKTIEEVEKQIRGKSDFNRNFKNLKFIKGFFEESLTSVLRNKLTIYLPSLITIDVDYYSSTKTVLNWLRPILKSGVIFYFDDIWSHHGNPEYGELKAISEFNDKENGMLIPFRPHGMHDLSYIFYNKEYEY